jgi:hypothetical protein
LAEIAVLDDNIIAAAVAMIIIIMPVELSSSCSLSYRKHHRPEQTSRGGTALAVPNSRAGKALEGSEGEAQ